jgi:hypothetical protein
MRARHRHFNPRHAGADLVLDARYLNQSDNTAVSSWADRSGNGHDASQATGASQPTFRTGQQGGNGGVDFDGSNDFLIGAYNPTDVPRTCHCVFKPDVSGLGTIFQVPQQPGRYGWIARWGALSPHFYISGDIGTNQILSAIPSNATSTTIGSWSSDASRNVSFVQNGRSLTVNLNAPNAVGTPNISGYRLGSIFTGGTPGSAIQYWDGPLFSVHVWTGEQIAAPIRKRCEHASAFSFKISCN